MKLGKYTPSQVRKFLVVVFGMVAEFGNQLIEAVANTPSQVHTAITAIVAVATAVGVFLTKNAPIIDAADNLD